MAVPFFPKTQPKIQILGAAQLSQATYRENKTVSLNPEQGTAFADFYLEKW